MSHDSAGIDVLRLQIGDYFGIAPIPEPEVIVDPGLSVKRKNARLGPRDRRSQLLPHEARVSLALVLDCFAWGTIR
jgi:hypothetical protein